MTARLLESTGVLVLVAGVAAADPASAQTPWTTLTPAGSGFSVEVPGTPTANSKPDRFIYEAEEWAYFVTISPVTDAVREFVGAADREPIKQYLERIHNGFLTRAKEQSRSDEDFEGYPSIRFSANGQADQIAFQGRYWLLVTEEHNYTMMAIGPQGTSSANADRFLGSFRLIGAKKATRSTSAALATALKAPMLAVAALITEHRLNPVIDQMLQRSPGAKRAGTRWNSTHPAWNRARASFSGRISKIVSFYDETGEMDRNFADAMARVAPGPEADAILSMLKGPAGTEILREEGLIHFVSTTMADDPNGPKAGERAYAEQMNALAKTFDDRLGSLMPRDKAHEAEAGKSFSTPAGDLHRRLWDAVVSKAASQIQGAANLVLFDDRDAISREIEAAIASVK